MAGKLQIDPPFSQGVGYGLILGIGFAFAIIMSVISWGLSRFFAERQTSEMFMTGKRSVKTGLTASAVVSSWTIASTLLTSTTAGYSWGISGPFWYGAGATVQILLFTAGAIEMKRKAPNCHTLLEFTRIRYGPIGHITLIFYSVFFLCVNTINLLVGGSAVFFALTGMNRDVAIVLLPIGVVVYSYMGGIKATFLADWMHTVIIYIIMLVTLFVAYCSSSAVGSIDRLYDLLQIAQTAHPIDGNADGAYLTMRSVQGGLFGLVIVGAGFSGCVDPQLSQKAIAANPSSTLLGYLLGGSAWFAIPFCLASTFGMLAAGLESLPIFPTYPNPMTATEVASGMAMPYAALAIMGKGGAMAILIMVFMAVTSAFSSETMALSALFTYDVYQAYINPAATGKQLSRVGHVVVPGFSIVVVGVAIGLAHAGFDVSFLITAVGIFVGSAFIPLACAIFWSKQNLLAFVGAPIISSCAAILAWMLVARHESHHISIATLSSNLALSAGNILSCTGPILLTPLLTMIRPQNYDWAQLKQIRLADDAADGAGNLDEEEQMEAELATESANNPALSASDHADAVEDTMMLKARKKAIYISIFMTFAFCLFWPVPMYASGYVFSRGFYKGWVVVLFLWGFYAALTIVLLPLWEGRHSIKSFVVFLFQGKKAVISHAAPHRSVVLEGVDHESEKSVAKNSVQQESKNED